jgi:hypothetical protein
VIATEPKPIGRAQVLGMAFFILALLAMSLI